MFPPAGETSVTADLMESSVMRVFVPPPNDVIPMMFNVDKHVGPACPNLADDVLLVQFLIRKSAERTPDLPPDKKARMSKVPTSGICDAATIDGIKAVQERVREKHPPNVVDGIVSPAKGTNYGTGIWAITILNSTVRLDFPERWPRLQDFPDCPPALSVRVRQVL
jgi:hypothetical protein